MTLWILRKLFLRTRTTVDGAAENDHAGEPETGRPPVDHRAFMTGVGVSSTCGRFPALPGWSSAGIVTDSAIGNFVVCG